MAKASAKPEEKTKRVRRSGEELAASFDAQIADLQNKIAAEEKKQKELIAASKAKIKAFKAKIGKLEAKKETALNPKPRGRQKNELAAIIKAAMKKGLTAEQIVKKLGVEIPE